VGLEARSPLLDRSVAEYAFGTVLVRGLHRPSKEPLRRIAQKLVGTELARARKGQFQTPLPAWFAGPLRGYVREQIDHLHHALPGVLSPAATERIQREHAQRSRDHALKLWSLVTLAEWSRLYPGLSVANTRSTTGVDAREAAG
jgi:hypothetical protein